MYQFIVSRMDTVSLDPNTEAPTTIKFIRDGTEVLVDTMYYQILRRAVLRERSNGTENKIEFIKAVRTFTGLGLRDAKVICEYFIDHFDINCGLPR